MSRHLPFLTVIRNSFTYMALFRKVSLGSATPRRKAPSEPVLSRQRIAATQSASRVMNAKTPVSEPLSEAELDQLSDFLAGLHARGQV